MSNNQTDLMNIVRHISLKKEEWRNLSIEKKISYLADIQDKVFLNAEKWVEVCTKIKRISSKESIAQEWLSGPVTVMRQVRFLRQGLLQQGKPTPKNISQTKKGQFVAQVMPESLFEKCLWRGFSASVFVQKGKPFSQGHFYQNPAVASPGLSLILGAGNVTSIAPLDALDKMYQEGHVCLVKLNPVCELLLPIFKEIFSCLIKDGYLDFVTGDGVAGSLLCAHPMMDHVHITGSHVTHDAIVWGPISDKETEKRRQANKPLLSKTITSELGCVTPAIIVPGVWSESDLRFQAKQIASALENNASFNCNAIKVIVTDQAWPQREIFLDCVRQELRSLPARNAYYPGAFERYQAFLDHYPTSEVLGEKASGCIPWTFIPYLEKTADMDYALQNEAFCGVLAEVSITSKDTKDFFEQAAVFCNERIWGTLSCCLFIDPKTQMQHNTSLEEAIESLRYGSVAVNCWSALSFALGSTTWGAYPGSSLQDVGSGIGMVKNGFFIDFPEKSVIHAPFRIWPKPVWFYDNSKSLEVAKALLDFERQPRLSCFFKVIFKSITS